MAARAESFDKLEHLWLNNDKLVLVAWALSFLLGFRDHLSKKGRHSCVDNLRQTGLISLVTKEDLH